MRVLTRVESFSTVEEWLEKVVIGMRYPDELAWEIALATLVSSLTISATKSTSVISHARDAAET